MKLLNDEMNKKWILYNEFELNKEYIKAVWIFYSLYDLSLAVCKIQDKDYKKKNKLIYKYLRNPREILFKKIKNIMIKDIDVINKAIRIIENAEEGGVQKGDYKKPTMVAINIYD